MSLREAKMLSLLVVGLLVWAGFAALNGSFPSAKAAAIDLSAPASTTDVSQPSTIDSPAANAAPEDTSWLYRIEPTLREAAQKGGKDLLDVIIYAEGRSRLAPVLRAYGVRQLPEEYGIRELPGASRAPTARPMSRLPGDAEGLVSMRATVPAYALPEIAKVPGVLGIEQPKMPKTADFTNIDLTEARERLWALREQSSGEGGGTLPADWGIVKAHRAYQTWNATNYTGDGVVVAVQDWGVDFAHPNLVGAWATVQNSSSPYYGYPIMHSQESIWNNLELFTADSDLDRLPYPIFFTFGTASWFSDTTYQARDTGSGLLTYRTGYFYDLDGDGFPDFQFTKRRAPTWSSCPGALGLIARVYSVSALPTPSVSGWYHLGVHKDKYLEGLWCERVGILVVDSTTPGVYDTVYVDLNDNYNFSDDKPLKVYDPADPLAPLAGWDVDGDGFYDVSGGLLYYVAQRRSNVTNEVVLSSATGKEKFATLANGWIETEILGSAGWLVTTATLAQNGNYWPSSTEDIWEPLVGNQMITAGATSQITGGYNLLSFEPVDSAWVLQNYNLSTIYDFSGSWSIPARAPAQSKSLDLTAIASPSAYQTTAGAGWSNPGNAFGSDDAYATAGGYLTRGTAWSGFNPNIPADATIRSVRVHLEWKRTGTFPGNLQFRVSPDGTTFGSFHPVADRTVEGHDVIDVTSDFLWTPARINDPNLKIDVTFAGGLSVAWLDWLGLEVVYTPAQWTNPGNVGASDDTNATATDTKGTAWYDFGFGIPSGATIDSVEVQVEGSATGGQLFLMASADGGRTWGDTHPVNVTPTESTVTVDISEDFGWTQAILNSTNFVIALVFEGPGQTASVDQVSVVVGASTTLREGIDYSVNMDTGTITWLRSYPYPLTADIIYQFKTWRLNYTTGWITFEAPPIQGATVNATYNTGLPVPYSDITARRQGWDLFVPGPGDLVAFHGAFELGQEHGTWVSSNLAGRPVGNFFGILDIWGTAPGAKIIGVDLPTSIDIAELFYFSSHGYDGIAGSGDEANIITNSWGFTTPQETGFTFLERYLYDLTTNVVPDVTILFAAGNNGPGYATSTPPNTAPGVITVGAGTLMNYRWLLESDGGDGWYDWPVIGEGPFGVGPYGDMADFSSKGPTLMGTPEPDVYAAGAFAFGGRPLNSACLEFYGGDTSACTGLDSWDLWGGTSLSAPVAAGVVALIYQAYKDVSGSPPTSTLAKEILMSSADDHGFDVLSQGAGWVNASAAVSLAADMAGLRVSPSSVTPGAYAGVHRPAFVNFLKPGESYTQTFTVYNAGSSPVTATVRDATYGKVGPDYVFYWDYTGGFQRRILKPTGLYAPDGATLLDGTDLSARWNAADFFLITLVRDPTVLTASPSTRWEFFDWCDAIACGGDADGIFDDFSERSRFLFSGFEPRGSYTAGLWSPKTRVHDGLVLRMRDDAGALGLSTVIVEFYAKIDWPFATTSVSSLDVAADGSATFQATFTVPPGTAPGMYQGAIVVSAGTWQTVVPVVITVPYTGYPITFGGGTPATSLYDNHGVRNGQVPGDWRQIGDSRLFWADFSAAPAANRRMIYSLLLRDPPSEGEIFVYALAPDPDFVDDAVYGPGTMVEVAATSELLGATNTLYPHREFLHTDVMSGLMAFQIKSLYSAASNEPFRLEIGTMEMNPNEARISSNKLSGSVPISVTANVPLYDGLGTAVLEVLSSVFKNQPVDPYPYPGGPFIDYLFNAPNKLRTEIPTGTIVATWTLFFHSGARDVDMGLFYDANCDGVYTVADDVIGTIAATAANPESATLSFPDPGCYWVHAAGFDVDPGSLYDLTLSISRIGISAYSTANLPTATVAANVPTGFDLTWNFPGSKTQGRTEDFLFVSPGFAPFALANQLTVIFNYDITPPSFSGQLPAPGSVSGDATPGIFVQVDDAQAGSIARRGEIDGKSIRIWLDGVDITPLASISVPHVTNQGYPTGTVLYQPVNPLAEGAHTVTVRAADLAGNAASTSWTFIVDTTAPVLDILSPTPGLVTSASSVTVQGRTEAGATVTVAGQSVPVDGAGQFSRTVALSEGLNSIDISAADAMGNRATTTLVVVRDTTAPAISLLKSSAGLLTREGTTVISGVVSEAASVSVAGIPASVHADGSFQVAVSLAEGANTITITATDLAGNAATPATLTVVRDTTPPALTMDALPSEVSTATVTVTGTVESGIAFVAVNGQPVAVSGGRYSADVVLSFGANVVFVEATDEAGNRAIVSAAVSYVPTGVTGAAVGLILLPVFTVIALLAGLALGQMRAARAGPPKEGEEKPKPPAEEELPPEGGEL